MKQTRKSQGFLGHGYYASTLSHELSGLQHWLQVLVGAGAPRGVFPSDRLGTLTCCSIHGACGVVPFQQMLDFVGFPLGFVGSLGQSRTYLGSCLHAVQRGPRGLCQIQLKRFQSRRRHRQLAP